MKAVTDYQIMTRTRIVLIGILLFIIYSPSGAYSQNKKTSIMENNKKIVQQGFDQWANRSGSFFDLLAEDLQWTITGSTPLSKTYTSKKQFMDEVINPLNDRLAQLIIPKITAIYADGNVVTVLWDGKATAKDGKPYDATYCWNMELKNGKIIRVIAFLDGIEFADIMSRLPGKNH